MKDKIIPGAWIKVTSPSGEHEEEYEVTDVVWADWNDIVPFSITTSKGVYRPTSSADGHWGNEALLGGWELLTK